VTSLMLFFVLALASLAQTAPTPKIADVSTDPHCKLIFQNEFTRVYMLNLAKGELSQFTLPNSFIRVSIDEASVALSADKSSGPVYVKKGAADFFEKGDEQYLENRGDGRYRAVYVEVLKGKLVRRVPNGLPVLGQLPPSAASVDADPLDLGPVTEIGYAIPPGEFTKWHSHKYPHLVVAVSDLELLSETKEKKPLEFEMKDGEVKWVSASAVEHRIGNAEKAQPEDRRKKLEREAEGEVGEDNEGAATFYAIEFK
jgi:hypothetical protein